MFPLNDMRGVWISGYGPHDKKSAQL